MQGNLLKLENVFPSKGNPEPVKRGKVQGFSKASRRRMIELCATMGKSIPIFVTLTYGARYPEDPKVWKKHLHTWGKRLIRYNGQLSAIWRLEPQKRGAPHYHLLIYQKDGKKPFIPHEWIASSWSKVLGDYSDAEHLEAGTRVESLKSHRGAAFYAAKYCAKLPEDDDFPESWNEAGRLWGSFNKSCLPSAKQHEMILHSSLEQRAALFVMKDAYQQMFIERKTSSYCDSGWDYDDAFDQAKLDWKQAVDENEYFGNTSTLFGSGSDYLEAVSLKIAFLECVLADKLGVEVTSTRVDFIDRAAACF